MFCAQRKLTDITLVFDRTPFVISNTKEHLTLHWHYSADLPSLTTDAFQTETNHAKPDQIPGKGCGWWCFFKSAMATPERVNTTCCFSLKNKKKSQRIDYGEPVSNHGRIGTSEKSFRQHLVFGGGVGTKEALDLSQSRFSVFPTFDIHQLASSQFSPTSTQSLRFRLP